MNVFVEIPMTSMIERMSNNDYHAHTSFSSSQLKAMLRSSAHFYSYNVIKEHEREVKKHLDFGTLAHTLFLEPELFNSEFVVLPANAPKQPTELIRNAKNPSNDSISRIQWWNNFININGHKTIISQEQFNGANRIAENLKSLSLYQDMKTNFGIPEASIFFVDPLYDLNLRIRPDWHITPCDSFPNGLIIDLKTARDARSISFSKACADYAYDLSAAMYREGFQQYYQTKDKPPFIFLVAENDAPFNVKQYKASDEFLGVGEKRYKKSKERLAESLLIDEWNGYSKDLEEIHLPSYLTKQALETTFA